METALLFALLVIPKWLVWDAPVSSPVTVDAYRVKDNGAELAVTASLSWPVDVGDYAPHTYEVTSIHWELDGSVSESAPISLTYQEPPPPPPPPPTGCLYQGTLYPVGMLLSLPPMKNGEVDAFLASVQSAGWVLKSKTKQKSLTAVVIECKP